MLCIYPSPPVLPVSMVIPKRTVARNSKDLMAT